MFDLYHKERDGYETIKNEFGFIIFKFIDGYCFIRDLYVAPDHRLLGKGAELADLFCLECKKRGVRMIYANCIPSTRIATESIKAILGYGFKIHSASNDLITLSKELF